MKSHVLLGTYSPEALTKQTTAPALNGKAVSVSTANGLQLGGAKVVKSVKTKEGYVHFLDGILND
ncbi:MAG: fasciclin domain-containing protein [Haliscomenobacter sp.]|nr:fasciclin domain-containing protein [Haliscomenobacter sp.]